LPLSLPPSTDLAAATAVAQRIRELAAAHGMTIRKEAELEECLNAIRSGDQIPVAAFAVVAEVLFTVLAAAHSPVTESLP
jgi:type III secretion system FlhB-like substrate exporter